MINSSLSVLFPGNSDSPIATTVTWIVLVLVVQLPMVSIYYREKHTFDELPTRENYYNDLNGNLRDQVAFKLKNTGSTSEANLHIISELTAAFTDELFTQKVIISEENELAHAVNDLLVRVQSYISERMKEKASIESIDLTTLANHISTSFEKNETRLNRSKIIKKKQATQSDCPPIPEKLVGILNIDFDKTAPSKQDIQEKLKVHSSSTGRGGNGEMLPGGHFIPSCKPKHKVAIIIPFRNREEHFMYFLWYMHPILQRQDIEYKIYIINQLDNTPFNRAMLLNVGFVESLKDYNYWDCFIFHDVDLVLENDNLLYHCPKLPRHMSVAVDKFNYRLPYTTIFGGVTALTKGQFIRLNGYSNKFNGWGGEDDDMFRRLHLAEMDIQRPDVRMGRYRMIRHVKDEKNQPNPKRFELLKNVRKRWPVDGLNSLLGLYTVEGIGEEYSYTNISVRIKQDQWQ